MEKVYKKSTFNNKSYFDYFKCSFIEEYDVISTLESLDFNVGLKTPCDCGDTFKFEAKRVIPTDSLKEAFEIADIISDMVELDVYPQIHQNNKVGTGFYLKVYFPTQIDEENELYGQYDLYIKAMYDSRPRYVELTK